MKFKHKRITLLILIDLAILLGTFALSLILKMIDGASFSSLIGRYAFAYLVFAAFIMAARGVLKLYLNVWRYANAYAYLIMVVSDGVGGFLGCMATLLIGDSAFIGGWESIATISMFCLLSLLSRFVYHRQYKHLSMRKADEQGIAHGVDAVKTDMELSSKEVRIIKILNTFPAKVAEAGAAHSPALIANYAYELAKEFNQYYHDTPILREENKDLLSYRLVLVETIARVLSKAMSILGITLPERM